MKTNKDYDVLTLYVNKTKTEEVIEHYKIFCWDLVKETENERFEDVVDLTFQRRHNIENKDELQLLQVYMEDNLNSVAKLERNKHLKSIIFELTFGPIGLALITLGLLFCFHILPVLGLIGGIVLAVLGLVCEVLIAIFVPLMVKKERNCFDEKREQKGQDLEALFDRVRILTGGCDE